MPVSHGGDSGRLLGDDRLFLQHKDAALNCLGWIDRYGDGLQEYQTRSPEGYENMAWKGANVPQAWATGSVFHLLQAILGLDANAHKKSLYVDPELPRWLPDSTLHNLRAGESTITLRFWKENKENSPRSPR